MSASHLATVPNAVRLDPRLPCDFDAILTEGETRRRVRIVDLSRSGALVEVSPLPDLATTCRLQFELPTAAEPLLISGRVVRQLTYECGVRFFDISPQAASELEKHLFVRTCVFGWFNYRRLFGSWQHLITTWLLLALSSLVLLFGSRQVLAPLRISADARVWLDVAILVLTLSPIAFMTSLVYGLRVGPTSARDALLFGRDPARALNEQLESIRRGFGLSSPEVESLRDIHFSTWHLPVSWWRVRLREFFVFALSLALFTGVLFQW